jgi:hypothetical protein
MIIMFGWIKEAKEIGSALDCYCYRCQRKRSWEHWKETEWVSIFTIKTIPFLTKTHVVCGGCRESILLDSKRSKFIGKEDGLARFSEFLEEQQLSEKSAVQHSYLLAQRSQNVQND